MDVRNDRYQRAMMDWVAIVAIVCVFGLPMLIPIVAILTHHRRKMVELTRQTQRVDSRTANELEVLRSQMQDLKNILLDHSMSLDKNVESLARRVENLENRLHGRENQN